MARILVVDDEDGIRRVLAQLFEYEDHEVRSASNAAEAIESFREFRPDVTFMDVKMPRVDGLEALTRLREMDPLAVVVMISGHGTIDTAVEATRRGAFDFLEKPLESPEAVRTIVRRALNWRGRAAVRPAGRPDAAGSNSDAAPPERKSRMRALQRELRRRHVYHAAATYAAICLAALQIGQLILPVLPVPGWAYAALVAIAIAGLPVVVTFGWIYDINLTRTSGVPISSRR